MQTNSSVKYTKINPPRTFQRIRYQSAQETKHVWMTFIRHLAGCRTTVGQDGDAEVRLKLSRASCYLELEKEREERDGVHWKW